jgi:hypothetical protein
MLTISKPLGRGRNRDEDIVGKDSGLLIALRLRSYSLVYHLIANNLILSSPKARKSHNLHVEKSSPCDMLISSSFFIMIVK